MEEKMDVVEEAVDKQNPAVDSAVEVVEETVDKKEEDMEQVEDMVENQEGLVEKEVETVDNMEEIVTSGVDNLESVEENPTDVVEIVENAVETVDNSEGAEGESEELTEEEPKKKSGIWKGIVALLILVLAGFWAYTNFAGAETRPILYAKDDGIYVADAAGESTLLHGGIGEDAGYHYYYGAWGALASEEGSLGYYLADVDESGIGTLYMQDMEKPAGETQIAENVFEFSMNNMGDTCMYLTLENESDISLHVAQEGVSQLVTDTMLLQESAFLLSADGTYVLFQEDDGTDVSLLVMDIATGEVTSLAEQSIMFTIAKESGVAYHIAYEDGVSVLYEYTHGVGEAKIAESIYFFDIMADGASVLYATMETEAMSCAELILDDVADLSSYDAERQQTILNIREQMETAEGIEPIFQDAFILQDGETIAVDRQIISLSPLSAEGNFFFGYGVAEFEKMPLSQINSLDEAIMLYYTELAYGEKEVFVANAAGEVYDLGTNGNIPTAMMLSEDGTKVAYLVTTDVGNTLVLETLGESGSAVEVGQNVSNFAFVGESHTLVYYGNYADGVGDLYACVDGAAVLLDSSVLGVSFSEDDGDLTYLANPDTTGNGEMKVYDGANVTLVAENVFSFQCREANSTVFMQGYDLTSGVGDIYHYFNGEIILIAEEATAIYMY